MSLVQPQFRYQEGPVWVEIKDADWQARAMFDRHYSRYRYADGREPKLINCAIFRNEGPLLSSELILAAERLALMRWGAVRLYTYVNAGKIRSTNPGYCFLKAGWQRCGVTKKRKLVILEKRHERE